MTSRGIEVQCLMMPEKRKTAINNPEIKLTGRLRRRYPSTKYKTVEIRFPIRMVSSTRE